MVWDSWGARTVRAYLERWAIKSGCAVIQPSGQSGARECSKVSILMTLPSESMLVKLGAKDWMNERFSS